MKRKLVALVLALACAMMFGCGEKAPESNPDGGMTGQTGTGINKNQGQTESAGGQTGAESGQTGTGADVVSISYEYEDDNKLTEEGFAYFFCSYVRPEVAIKGYDAAAAKINEFFDDDQELFEEQTEDYAWDAKDYYDTTQGQALYSWYVDVSGKRADAGVISFVRTENVYLGGAHGSYVESGLVFDTKTGEQLALQDLSEQGDAFYQMVKEEVLRQCKEYPEQEGFFFPTDSQEFADAIEDILAGDNWYFTKSGLVVVANIYSIAPYAAGNFMFEIPYDELEGLKEEYVYTGAYMKEVSYEEDFFIDLDGDGQEDKIQTSISRDEYYEINEIVFVINDGDAGVKIDNNYTGEDTPSLEIPSGSYHVVDLDQSDSFLEIAIGDYGMNDYNRTFFYRYEGGKLNYLGYIPDMLENAYVNVYGNGMISGTLRTDLIETVKSKVFYQLKDGEIRLVEQEWYEPDYSYFMEEYLSHDVLLDVTVYKEPSLQSEKVVLTQGEEDVRFLATDNAEWVKIQTEDGEIYYVHMAEAIVIDSDGQNMMAPEVFENILLAG